ncbi:c-type cytochrome [Komagataeibacter swingsii]|uniref:Cytochrome c domain-containing protein n=1 Tax=Komagataeibacter swingsii TaxID=215220 RepID=A0A2V4S6V2_9PROT|nr:cytochrome c [Komagataeibacter swingsii]PYD70884.1 hypothetical protein CFR76_02870 [Komagataeibacter swingsii]GBQ60690.1 cytochrome c-552 class I [Komagataeibacter swingsii DSM 16373]
MIKKTLSLLAVAGGLVAGIHGAHAAEDGQQLYGANCGLCHQAGATGVPGQFPPLKGRLDVIAASPEGKSYLSHLVLNGMTGSIQAGGATYMGYMPSFRAMTDEQLAAILTYVSHLGGNASAPSFSADEIHAARDATMPPTAVLQERNALNDKKKLP